MNAGEIMNETTSTREAGSMDRRGFWIRAWGGLLALGALLLGSREAAGAETYAVDLDEVPSLEEVGGGTHLTFDGKKVLVIRVSEKKVAAIEPTCTHERCTVLYQKSWGEIRCHCHGSRFSKWGKVTEGPAEKNLKLYPAWLADGKVKVKL
jgi:cytochrome b6-f complex iron-sulfur subunit